MALSGTVAGKQAWFNRGSRCAKRRGATVTDAPLRAATASDAGFLAEMLAVAIDWRPGATLRPAADLMDMPDIWHCVDAWPQQSDFGLVAEIERPVGAAWWRYFTAAHRGYGFIDEAVPEISIGIANGYRGQGIGRSLLLGLISEGSKRGIPGLGLSVEPENPALRLYERLGFEVVGGTGGSITLLLRLNEWPALLGRP